MPRFPTPTIDRSSAHHWLDTSSPASSWRGWRARHAACRHLAYDVARRLDAGGDSADASLAKLIACRAAEWVTREALQIHGGMGYAEESAASRYWVDARVLSIFEGAEETLALKVIARRLLEDAL